MSPKIKVLFLLEAFDKGGIEKVTLDIVNHLDPAVYDITVQTFWFGGHCQSQVAPHVKVIPFFFRRYVRGIIRLIDLLSPRMLYRLFVHGDYDVEIAASDGGAAKVISGSTNPHSRKICWVHMDVVERGSKLKEFANADTAHHIYSRFDVIAPVSAACRDQFVKKFGESYPLHVVHNPLPEQEILEKSLESAPLPFDQAVTFVSVGRLAVEKGFDRIIDASARLVDEGYAFCVCLIGAGPLKEALSQQIRAHELQNTVILEGYSANPYPYISASNWYICASLDEAFPLSVGEALILGKPVLGTRCAGTQEWLGENEYGILLENSADGVYRGMKTALDMSPDDYTLWKSKATDKAVQLKFEKSLAQWQTVMIGTP